jgi:hypothetical protein
MSLNLGRTGRTLALATAIVGGIGLTLASSPAHAISTGEAVGIGVGAAAVGAAVGAAASPGYYAPAPAYPAPVYGAPAPAYYQQAPGYGYGPGPSGSCWNPSYGRYTSC